MADGGDRLVGHGEFAHDGHRALVHPQDVGVDLATGQQQRVIAVAIFDRIDGLVDGDAFAPVLFVPAADRTFLETDDDGFDTRLLQIGLGLHQFGLFEAIGGEDHYALGHGKLLDFVLPMQRAGR